MDYIILSRKSQVTFRVRFFTKIQIRILIRQRIFHFFTKIWKQIILIQMNACTLVPTVFRWHKKMEFKFPFYFSFFFGLVKWNSISISIFRFLSTCDIEKRIRISFFVFAALWKGDLNFGFCFSFSHHFEKRIWISFFVFRFRITLENGFQFRFSYLHCLLSSTHSHWKTDWSFVHEFEKWINTPVIWNSTHPSP